MGGEGRVDGEDKSKKGVEVVGEKGLIWQFLTRSVKLSFAEADITLAACSTIRDS